VVAQTGEPAVVDDLTDDPRFARELAKETGYVPDAIMVAPLLRGERTLGVLSVLDRGKTGRTTMQELELLAAFGQQAALALDLGEAARRAEELLRGEGDAAAVARLAGRLEHLDGDRREAAAALLDTLERLLR
jgi:GAF domain-containing protein